MILNNRSTRNKGQVHNFQQMSIAKHYKFTSLLTFAFILTYYSLNAQNIKSDHNQDGFFDLSPTIHLGEMLVKSEIFNDCYKIGIVQTGTQYQETMDRLNSIGFNNVNFIPDTSGISVFNLYDIIYLPTGWAEFGIGAFEEIEAKAEDYKSYVASGGNLFVEQPNPFQNGFIITPTILPFPITFNYSTVAGDFPPTAVDPTHEITIGIDPSDLAFPADRMIAVDSNYYVLVVGSTSLDPSLVITEYEHGKILVCTAPSSGSSNVGYPMGDEFYGRLINWLGSRVYVDPTVVCDSSSYIWIDGITYSSNTDTTTFTLISSLGCDSTIVLDLTIGASVSGTDVISTCEPYTWIDGITYSSDTDTATYTLSSSIGCDSIITLDLTINTIDTSIVQMDSTLTSNAAGASYQWLNCDNGYSIMVGETNQSILITENGYYAVEISNNGCIDTSDCILVLPVNVIENESMNNDILIYPNPTYGQVTVNTGNLYNSTIQVYDTQGKLIQTLKLFNENVTHLDLDIGPNIYFVKIIYGNEVKTMKIVKNRF